MKQKRGDDISTMEDLSSWSFLSINQIIAVSLPKSRDITRGDMVREILGSSGFTKQNQPAQDIASVGTKTSKGRECAGGEV